MAHQVWQSIENQILPTTIEKEQLLNEKLTSLKKGNMSLDEYLKKFKGLCDSLDAIKKPMDDTSNTFQLARGLGAKYKDFRTAMLAKAPYPTYNQFVVAPQAHEQMMINESEEKDHLQPHHEHAFVGQKGRG